MNVPEKIDLKALEESKKKNREEKLKFLDQYVKWVKKQPNKVWSSQQKKLFVKKRK